MGNVIAFRPRPKPESDLNDCIPLGPVVTPVIAEQQLRAALLLAESALEAACEQLGLTDDYRPIHIRPSVVAKIDRAKRAIEGVKP